MWAMSRYGREHGEVEGGGGRKVMLGWLGNELGSDDKRQVLCCRTNKEDVRIRVGRKGRPRGILKRAKR